MADLFEDILKVFDALGLWEDGVELIGSWSFLLYQRHLGVRLIPLRTLDIDFLLPRPYPRKASVDLQAALAPLGFRIDFKASGETCFAHPDLKIEFLTPERGKGENQPRLIKSLGIKATQLRFLDLLFQNPIVIEEKGIRVRVPSPISFSLQKLIVAQRRKKKEKREKDIEQAVAVLSVVDPAEFARMTAKLPKKWRALLSKSLLQAWDTLPLERPVLDKIKSVFTPQKP